MNKIIKGLLIIALTTLSAQNVAAYTNKTFLQPRNQALVNLPLIKTTWSERVGAKVEDRFGGNFEVVGFYGQNTNKSEVGKYFGIVEKNSILLTRTNALAANATTGELNVGYIIHEVANVNADFAAAVKPTIKIDPESIHYGVDLAYHQDLSKIVNGLYLKVILPVAHVENDAKLKITGAGDNYALNTPLVNFFKGTYTCAIAANHQGALSKAKINGKQSATGVADIDIALGYKFLNKETYRMGINIGLSIPTGKESTGEYMFEPTYGTKHFGLGGGLHAGARIWGDEDHNFKISFAANYRYLFQASEKRTFGLKDRNWGQYTLLSPVVGAGEHDLVPAANVLTLNADITPGSQLDGILGLAYNKGGFNVDLGYNMYFRESESVKMKDHVAVGTYGVATRAFDTSAQFRADGTDAEGAAAGMITDAKIDVAAASTDSQFTHSIYGGLGYAFKEWEYPLMFGVGGKYEFASKNSALEGWQAWLKAGLSF